MCFIIAIGHDMQDTQQHNNAKDNSGHTVLHLTVIGRHWDAIKNLLKSKADFKIHVHLL